MNAEYWLADLEAKADAASHGRWKADGGIMSPSAIFADDKCIAQFLADNDAEYFVTANPAAVKRLVAMVRRLALSAGDRGCPTPLSECPNGYPCDECFILKAYQQTEPKP